MSGSLPSEEKLSISFCCLPFDCNDFLVHYKEIGNKGLKWKEFMFLDINSCLSLLYGQYLAYLQEWPVSGFCSVRRNQNVCSLIQSHSGKFKANGHKLVIRQVKHRGCLHLCPTPTLVPASAFYLRSTVRQLYKQISSLCSLTMLWFPLRYSFRRD